MKSKVKPIAVLAVGHLKIPVYVAPEPLAEAAEMRGMFDPARNEIWVGEASEGLVFQEVFWHELLHAFYRTYGWDEEMAEEELVKHLSPALVSFIAMNPKFVADYLT